MDLSVNLSHGLKFFMPLPWPVSTQTMIILIIFLLDLVCGRAARTNSGHKLSLYADDVLLFASDPDRSIPLVLDLKEFGQVSG